MYMLFRPIIQIWLNYLPIPNFIARGGGGGGGGGITARSFSDLTFLIAFNLESGV